MKTVIKYFLTTVLLSISYLGVAQRNLLLENRNLLLEISKYDMISDFSDSLIKVQMDVSKAGFVCGIANRFTGKLILSPHVTNSSYIGVYKNFIALAKGTNWQNIKYGVLNFEGDTIVDFIYDNIGVGFVPLPDSIIVVQQKDKFGVFNVNTGKLSEIKYDNSGEWLNDGYAYHDGGSYFADSMIYSQLGITDKSFHSYDLRAEAKRTVFVHDDETKHDYGVFQYLVNENDEKISNKYYFIEPLRRIEDKTFFIGFTALNPHKYKLLNDKGEELTDVHSYLTDYNNDFIYLGEVDGYPTYFFVETEQIVTAPVGYSFTIDCYSDIGVLVLKKYEGKSNVFIDKYGNSMNEDELRAK